MYRYPRGCRAERKKDDEVGRCETVRPMWDTGIVQLAVSHEKNECSRICKQKRRIK
jgi:hypothetical protein